MRTRPVLMFVVVVVAVFGTGLWFSARDQSEQQKPDTTAVVEDSISRVIIASGQVSPTRSLTVGAQVSGQLKSLHVQEGESVSAGQLLAEIDDGLARADLLAAEATLESLSANVQAREAEVSLSELRLKRLENLLSQEAASEIDVAEAKSEAEVAEATLNALMAQIREAEAEAQRNRTSLQHTRIEAPMDGVVLSIQVQEGQILNANNQVPLIMEIADLSVMTVTAQVAEADIFNLNIGMPAVFKTLGRSGRQWKGELEDILPAPDETQNNVVFFRATFNVANEDAVLLPRMTAQIEFIQDQRENEKIVPISSIYNLSSDEKTATIDRWQDGEGVESITVDLLLRNQTMAAIRSDQIAVGDEIVTGKR